MSATEALLGAAMHGVGGIVANESPTGESQRYLARGWLGEPSRSEDDLDALVQSVTVLVAKRSRLYDVRDALLAPQLRLAQRLLVAGVFRGPDGGIIQPALPYGEHSLWQCISALTSREATTALEPFDVAPYADFCGRCDWLLRRHAHPCKHLVFCRGLVLVQRNGAAAETELPWWSADTPMYLNLERFRSATASAPAAAAVDDTAADGGGEKVITAVGLEDLIAALGEQVYATLRLVGAVAAAVGNDAAASQARTLAISELRAVSDAAITAADSMAAGGSVPTGGAAPPGASTAPVPVLVDHARAVRCADTLRAATGLARTAVGDMQQASRSHGGGRAGLLDKSAKSAAEVTANHRRLATVPAPRLELRGRILPAGAPPAASQDSLDLLEARHSPRFAGDAEGEVAPVFSSIAGGAAAAAAAGSHVLSPRDEATASPHSACGAFVDAGDGGDSVAESPPRVPAPSAAGHVACAGQKHGHSRTPGGDDRAVRQRR